jgi:hypothetical protein
MRTFYLFRKEDPSGVSGTGYVAEGCEFSDGGVVVRWTGGRPSFDIHRTMEDAIAIHGHDGKTVVEWAEDEQWK